MRKYPVELAYTLALIHADDRHSITPPWVQKNYPKVEEIVRYLRNTPCQIFRPFCSAKLDVRAGLKEFFGFDGFRNYNGAPLQERVAQAAQGRSLLAVFPTGGGKSVTFQFPALMAGETLHGLTVVISPLQSLMKDQVDNLNGFSEAILACFPNTEIQKCVIHQILNSIRYVSYKDANKLLANLKPVYTAASEDAALPALDEFEGIWGSKYPLVIQSWRRNWGEIATFFKYPPEIRKLIYTTNMIESYHRQLRKVTKAKIVFPTDEALLKMLYHAQVDLQDSQLGADSSPA